MAELVVDNVVKRYGSIIGVDHISLHCGDGEFLALLGPSGCGKSSTMRMIAGLEEISEGSIYIGGRRANHIGPADRNVAMAFENFGLYPHRTVFGNIAYPLRLRGESDESIARAVVDISTILGITDLLEQNPGQLSVGAKQRVSVARALVRKPALFLMDEPFSHVDAELRSHMRSELKRLHMVNGSTSLYVTHDQLEAMSMADRIVIMNKGAIQQIGTPDEVFQHPLNRFVAGFIGEPPMNFLRADLVQEGPRAVVKVEHRAIFEVAGPQLDNLRKSRLDGPLDLGVRPDDFSIAAGSANALQGRVRVREVIGRSAFLTVDTASHRLRVRGERDRTVGEGSLIYLRPDPGRVHFFHHETGLSLRGPVDKSKIN
jgi:multiple sugar transport system ATP-binding protein